MFALLPARLRDAGDETGGGELAEGDTGNLEAAQVSAAAAGELAAVRESGGARVAWKLGKSDVVAGCLQLGTKLRIFFNGLPLALVALKP